MREENQTIIKALNMFGRVPETWELLNEIERLNNKIKEQSLLLIEFQDMEQRLKKKDNIIDELEKWLEDEANFWKQQQEKAIKNGWLEFGGKYNTTIIYENVINKLKELKGSDEE